jgi:hypothetical protein
MKKKQPKEEKRAEQYMTICNLFEALWLQRRSKNYYDVDTDNLPPLTSPQARKLAAFVFEVLEIE